MDKKKLIIYGISILLTTTALIVIIIFAGRLLKKPDTKIVIEVGDEELGLEDIGDIVDATNNHNPKDDDLDQGDNPDNDMGSEPVDDFLPVEEPIVDEEDPQHEKSEGLVVDVRDIEKSDNVTDETTYGIDVAKWQGVIDWAKVKKSGVEFAMIRVGYRTLINGEITEDPYGKYNLQEAQKHGIKTGVYFFSTAINKKEAEEEAEWVAKLIAPYKITYPVVYNCEGFSDSNNRQYRLTKDERTDLATVFLDYIKGKGYSPMFYASKNELDNNRDWNADLLTKRYKIWVAQYPKAVNSKSKSSYSGIHEMWQYTSNGKVPGIKEAVDLNIAYFGYVNEKEAKDDSPVKEVIADPLALISFTDANETVTSKEITNLRGLPGLDNDSKVVEVLHYGDTAKRTGIGDNGWSRVEYKGKTLYAVSSYLTTDLNYKDSSKPSVDNPEAGIHFDGVNEKVTAKIVTNLRLLPNADSDETIVVSLENGQTATRTGIGSNGWSRLEYEGQILYAVTNFLELVEE